MALARVDSLDGLPEALAKEYVAITEGDAKGRFQLKVESVDGLVLEDVSGLKTALSRQQADAKAKAKELNEFRAKFEGLDDPEAAKSALEAVAKGLAEKPNVQAQVDAAVRQVAEKHGKAIKEKEARETALRSEIERLLIDATAAMALADEGGNAELLLPHVRSMCSVEEVTVDGRTRFVARVKDADGNTRITSQTGKTDPMSVRELVSTDLKHKFPAAYSGSGASGGGGSGQDKGSGGKSSSVDLSKMDPVQRLQHLRDQGLTGAKP